MRKLLLATLLFSAMPIVSQAADWCNVSDNMKGTPGYTLAAYACEDAAKQKSMLDSLEDNGFKFIIGQKLFAKAANNQNAATRYFKDSGQLVTLKIASIEQTKTDKDGNTHAIFNAVATDDNYASGVIQADVMIDPSSELISKVPYAEKSSIKANKIIDTFTGKSNNLWVGMLCSDIDYSYRYIKLSSCIVIGSERLK